MSEIDELEPELVDRLSRFLIAKTRARRGGGRTCGCLCHKPDGVVKRRMRDRYLPMPDPEKLLMSIFDETFNPGWAIYDRKEERFLTTDEVHALPERAMMDERLPFH